MLEIEELLSNQLDLLTQSRAKLNFYLMLKQSITKHSPTGLLSLKKLLRKFFITRISESILCDPSFQQFILDKVTMQQYEEIIDLYIEFQSDSTALQKFSQIFKQQYMRGLQSMHNKQLSCMHTILSQLETIQVVDQ